MKFYYKDKIKIIDGFYTYAQGIVIEITQHTPDDYNIYAVELQDENGKYERVIELSGKMMIKNRG